jgi:tetratricopeptide (TPR) repeat protein
LRRRRQAAEEEDEETRQQRQQQIAREQSMLRFSEEMRSSANDLFREGKFREAISQYSEAQRVLEFNSASQVINNKRIEEKIHCLNNKAACYLKLEENQTAVEICTEVLSLDSKNYKALYRRAQAYMNLSQFQAAYKDIKRAQEKDPDDPSLKKLLKELKQLTKEAAAANNSNNNNNNNDAQQAMDIEQPQPQQNSSDSALSGKEESL